MAENGLANEEFQPRLPNTVAALPDVLERMPIVRA